MKILMIDRNSMVDRRIILEAKTLRSLNHEVMLIAAGSPNKPPIDVIDGLKIFRIFNHPIITDKKVQCVRNVNQFNELIHEALNKEAGSDKQLRQLKKIIKIYKSKKNQERFRKILSKVIRYQRFATLIFGLFYPREIIEVINQSNLSIRQKTVLLRLYSLLTFSPGIISDVKKRIADDATTKNNFLFPDVDSWERKTISTIIENFCKPDVIHAHDYPALKTAVNVAHLLSIPLIYDAHELYSYQAGLSETQKKKIFDEEKKLIPHCHSLVLVNKEQADIMAKDFGTKKYALLTNATEQPSSFVMGGKYNLIREKLGLGDETKILLFQGGINKYRKIDLLLEGLAKTPPHIHMAFLTFGGEIPEFKQLAADLGIRERVHFLDLVPWSEVVFWAASADAGIMPYQPTDMNTTLSLPNKMYEFIIAGTPMIAHTGLVNVNAIVGKEGYGVLHPLDEPQDYADAINIMFDESLGGSERFKKNLMKTWMKYEWEALSKDFVKHYQSLAAHSVEKTLASVS